MKHAKILLLLVFITYIFISGKLTGQNISNAKDTGFVPVVIKKDNPIVAALDSLALLNCFEKAVSTEKKPSNKYNYAAGYVPSFSDSVYAQRIAKLNSESPFGLTYNIDVKNFIDLYAVKKRALTQRILGLSKYYFPLFEEYLDKYHIPLELKYLAVVESALNPIAKSPAAANGLWQFIYGTGKMYNLTVTSYIDDRFDPLKSTIAACRHFKDLYAIYKDWSLVLAAYNSGPGNVNKAIRKANGEMDFWKIKKYLPRETQGYVPAFIAVVYVMNYAEEHNLYAVEPTFKNFEIDTVTVKNKLTFDQISEALNIPIEDVTYLNPMYKQSIIPAFGTDYYILRLPKSYIGDYIANEDSLYLYKTKAMIAEEKLLAEKLKQQKIKDSIQNAKYYAYKNVNKTTTTATNTSDTSLKSNSNISDKTYTVKAGDGLGLIAEKYKTTINQIQLWNKLNSYNIYPGQVLYVQDPTVKDTSKTSVTTPVTANNTKTETKSQVSPTTKIVYHTVQKGDTLWGIANQYKGVSVEEIKKLNNLSAKSQLYVGQKLKIAIAS